MKKKCFLNILELISGIFLIGAAIYLSGIKFYSCSNSWYLYTTDAVPIYTKVKYCAECLKNLQWPSWFPNWYCGTSVSQYYPPLTLLILTPLELIFNNSTICLKIYIFSGLFLGGIGIWYIYHRYIGKFFGIIAAILYVTLPYFMISFLFWGTIAQVPIIAIAPWYMLCCIEFYKKPKVKMWMAIILLTFILLLSHVMHGFMIAVSVFVTMMIVTITKRKRIPNLLLWGIGTGLAAGILGFWWLIGVLPLENPEVPSLAGDAAKSVTANLSWFFPKPLKIITDHFPDMTNIIDAYFPYSLIILAVFSYIFIKREKIRKNFILIFLYVLTIFSFIFSFGSYLPFFKYIPLANSLVPGRILTQTAIGSVILSAYLFSRLMFFAIGNMHNLKLHRRQALKKILACMLLIMLVILTLHSYTNKLGTVVTPYKVENNIFSVLDNKTQNFEKGRLSWFGGNFTSIYTYFGYISRYNIVSGWNIEGTSTADYLRFQNTALAYKKGDYILKNMYDMNVQTYLVDNSGFPWLSDKLRNIGFSDKGTVQGVDIFIRKNWSYFMEQVRDSIVIGKSSDIFLADCPWFVKGPSSNPSDYKEKYLDQFKVIYYCEPQINTTQQLKSFEQQIKHLVNQGKHIFIEFGRSNFPESILGVSAQSYLLSGKYTIVSNDNLNSKEFFAGISGGEIVQLIGLDNSLYKLKRNTGKFDFDLIGTKSVGNGKVYFLGGPVTQLKSFAYNYLTGNKNIRPEMERRDKTLTSLRENIFRGLNMYKKLELPPFEAENVEWNSNSCNFTYSSSTEKMIMASITYTPRWKVYIDSIQTEVSRIDNMLCFKVPAGKHHVNMKYGMTAYGKIGIGITFISLLIIVILIVLYNKVFQLLKVVVNSIPVFLELKGSQTEKSDLNKS
jgi:hypothetical protein